MLTAVLNLVLRILFPPWCQSCGWIGSWICRRCWEKIQFFDEPSFKPLNAHPSLKQTWSLARYDEQLGSILQKFKYSGVRVLGDPLGKAMARQCEPWLRKRRVEVLIPVPLHRKRQKQRGFNQAGILAHVLSQQTSIPVEWNALQRVTWSGSQAKQDRAGRQQIQTAFRAPHRLPYRCVCLVDDVLTTSSTLSACARALNQAGVKTVVALTIARAGA